MTSNKVQKLIFGIGCLIVLLFIAGFVLTATSGIGNKGKISKNVSIDTVDVSGMTEAEATSAVQKFLQMVESRSVIVEVGSHKIDTTYQELGYRCDVKKYVKEAMQIGKKGSLFDRYMQVRKAKKNKVDIAIAYSFSEEALHDFVQNQCVKYDCKAKNASLTRKDGKFIIKKEQTGQVVQVAETEAAIKKALDTTQNKKEIVVKAVMKVQQPKYTSDSLKQCKDLMSEFSTSYASSTAARANNVQTAAGYINGTILYPGDVFSTIATIKDRTEANGYQSAPEYNSGAVVDGIGGGVCQVATTLYNTVLNAELKIVQRQPHSMPVHYVSISRDAAIAGDYKDFKFENNTDAPIYIEADASGGVLRFRIYGHDERAKNRKITFETKILETLQPGEEKKVVDSTKPASYREVTKSAVTGYRAELWKHIFVDGKEVKKELVNSSTYNPVAAEVTVGSKPEATPEPEKTEAPNDDDDPENIKFDDAKKNSSESSEKTNNANSTENN